MVKHFNLIAGTIFKAKLPVFEGSFKNPKFSHNVDITARVVKESYSERGQHTFTFEVLETTDSAEFAVGKKYRKKGRNLYANITEIVAQPDNYDELAEEKRKRKEEMREGKEAEEARRRELVRELVSSGMDYAAAVEMSRDVVF